MSTSYRLERYHSALRSLPVPGQGQGFHSGILRVANLARVARVKPSELFRALRRVADRAGEISGRDLNGEILQAIRKAFNLSDDGVPRKLHDGAQPRPCGNARADKTRPTTPIPPKVSAEEQKANRFGIHQGRVVPEESIIQASPVVIPPLEESVNLQAILLFKTLYHLQDYLFVGERYSSDRPLEVSKLILGFQRKPSVAARLPFVIPNPLSGNREATKSGKLSWRADNCVLNARFLCIEFDSVPLDEQLTLYAHLPLPIAALIFSGSKSIHAWLDVSTLGKNRAGLNPEEWQSVMPRLKSHFLALGADPTTFNRSRLSRLPGHFRAEKGKHQRLLYLNPDPDGSPIIFNIKERSKT